MVSVGSPIRITRGRLNPYVAPACASGRAAAARTGAAAVKRAFLRVAFQCTKAASRVFRPPVRAGKHRVCSSRLRANEAEEHHWAVANPRGRSRGKRSSRAIRPERFATSSTTSVRHLSKASGVCVRAVPPSPPSAPVVRDSKTRKSQFHRATPGPKTGRRTPAPAAAGCARSPGPERFLRYTTPFQGR